MRRRTIPLPVDYDPNEDGGKFALQLFLDEKDPPDKVEIELRDGRFVAVGSWKFKDPFRGAGR